VKGGGGSRGNAAETGVSARLRAEEVARAAPRCHGDGACACVCAAEGGGGDDAQGGPGGSLVRCRSERAAGAVLSSVQKKTAKMSLYPSLEDLKVDKVIQAQAAYSAGPATQAVLVDVSASFPPDGNLYPKLYPELSQYMGLTLNEEEICANMPMVSGAPSQGQLVARPSSINYMVAPVTGNDAGIRRAEIKQGIREVILCKDQDGKIGLRLKSIDNGIFVQLVQANSPASLVGLRFGDQVLQINGDNCAGWSSDKAHKVLKQAFGEKITMTIRDRPFERTITMHKDSSGHVGFIFKSGKITSIVKDSSAARNGLLTEHHICEINGQNVIGLKDSQIADILSTAGTVVTITIMPAFIFEHIIKRMAPSIMKSLMDHTIPEV
ncbi:Sdcbp, partial [Lemmus lemmus]